MLTTVFLSTILMLWAFSGADASDLQVSGKSIHSDKSLSGNDGRHSVRKQPHSYQTKSEIRRSLDLESLKVQMAPTSRSKFSRPTIIKLYPPTPPPLHMHANMPMRFGRDSDDEKAPNSSPNMPQRFGRAWEVFEMCAECPGVIEALQPPPRPWRRSLYWSLLRTLAT